MALILIGFTLITLIDLIPIIRRRYGHAAAAFLLLVAPALTLAVLQVSGTELPSVMLLLWKAFKAIRLSY